MEKSPLHAAHKSDLLPLRLKGRHRCEKDVRQVGPKSILKGNPGRNSAGGSAKEINKDQKAREPKVAKFELVKSLKALAAPCKIKDYQMTGNLSKRPRPV